MFKIKNIALYTTLLLAHNGIFNLLRTIIFTDGSIRTPLAISYILIIVLWYLTTKKD